MEVIIIAKYESALINCAVDTDGVSHIVMDRHTQCSFQFGDACVCAGSVCSVLCQTVVRL